MGLVDEIKATAKGNNTKIQSSDAAALEKILNQMFFLPKDIEKETAFVKQVMTRGLESAERVGLHASALITGDKQFCLRQQVLSLMYKQLQGEQLNPGLKRIFEEGNAVHEKWQRLFLRAGYSEVDDLDVTQFNKQWRISYTPDVKCLIPGFFEGRMIGEIKSVNTYQFQKMSKHPSAWKQCQWYMALEIAKEKKAGTWNGIDWTKGFVLSEDKNTQEPKVEVYDHDPLVVAPFIERAETIKTCYKRVHTDGKMVPRPADAKSPECKRCHDCPMRDACWNVGMGRVKL